MPATHASRISANGFSADRKPANIAMGNSGLPEKYRQFAPAPTICQALTKSGLRPRSPSRARRAKPTFEQILDAVHSANMTRVKERALHANQLSKITEGRSRQVCYLVKNRAISVLIKQGVAFLNSVSLLQHDPELGISFLGGGKLHTKPTALDSAARQILAQHVATAVGYGSAGARA